MTADVVSLVHGLIARAGSTGVVVAYGISWNDTRCAVKFDDGQGVPLDGSGRPTWPVEGWCVREDWPVPA